MGDKTRISQVTVHSINIYRQAAGSEKYVADLNMKPTPSQKEAIRKICAENGMDMGAFVRNAVDVYIDLFPYHEKITKYRRDLRRWLELLA